MRKLELNKILSNKIVEILIESLVIGFFLVILGYWLDVRLEEYKNELEEKSGNTQLLQKLLGPQTQHRIQTYNKIQVAAYKVLVKLDLYYKDADKHLADNKWINKLHAIQQIIPDNDGFVTYGFYDYHYDTSPINALEELVHLVDQEEDALSELIKQSADKFIEVVMMDLSDSINKENQNAIFHGSALTRARNGYSQLRQDIRLATGYKYLPVK